MRRPVIRRLPLWGAVLLLGLAGFVLPSGPGAQTRTAQRFPNVLIVTIDTLRADRLSAYGYHRPTTPALDKLLASGVRFSQARTVEPLTNPALCAMFTSTYPHENGATRNGLRMREGLPSVAATLGRRGYRTAAFVGNWTLRNEISGLGEHFQSYEEVFTRKRWYGLFKGEATAQDLTEEALAWLQSHTRDHRRPFLLWVHYVEPHAPYRLQEDFAGRLGVAGKGDASRHDRYDTEVAFVDHWAGRLLAAVETAPDLRANTLVVFAADHGESLGEHGYWGHGRNLYEPSLRIPLGFSWPGRIRPGVIDAPAVNLDVAPTILGLAGLPAPPGFKGFDWSRVMRGEAEAPRQRIVWFQAHKGAVLSAQEAGSARRNGLLEVAMLTAGEKEIFRPNEKRRWIFNLFKDPRESRNLARGAAASRSLEEWMLAVHQGLTLSDRLVPTTVEPEDVQRLRALGYVE